MTEDSLKSSRLTIDLEAIANNWRTLNTLSGKAGAAVKANAYGLGVKPIAEALYQVGCRDFFVANWSEADQLKDIIPQKTISVLNGVDSNSIDYAKAHNFKPVLNTPQQINIWRDNSNKPCDVMLDSGMNRLGIDKHQISSSLFDGLDIDIVMSHLASADESSEQNNQQRLLFDNLSQQVISRRKSLSNSAGIALGSAYNYDLSRPGLSLYGGLPRAELNDHIKPVVQLQVQILQVKKVFQGECIGYNATYKCPKDMMIATAALGYADGYFRGFSDAGHAYFDNIQLPVIGRVSMDLITIDISSCPNLSEADWINIPYNLYQDSLVSGMSQYELLTSLGIRFERLYIKNN